MELSKKKIYEKIKKDQGIVWSLDVEKANEEAFKEHQKLYIQPRDEHPVKYWFRDKFIKYFVPDNIKYLKGLDTYQIYVIQFPRVNIKSNSCNFYLLCISGWLFKLSKKFLYKAQGLK